MVNGAHTKIAGNGKLRKNRINKNKKKNWKNIDVSKVEDALDVERLELRTGGIISEKTDDELFFIDKKFTTAKSQSKTELRKSKRLRTDQIIVPDPSAVKPASKTSKRVKRKMQKALDKKLQRKSTIKTNSNAESNVVPFDLWANESLALYDKETKKTNVAKHTDDIIGKRQIRRPKHLENDPKDVQRYKYRETPAVEVPHPGASYNPTYDDHQTLLSKAHLIEVDKLKKQQRIDKALHVPYEDLPDQDTYAKEMQEGLFGREQEFEKPGEEKDDSDVIANAPVRAGNRKTRRKRRLEEKEKQEKELKKKLWSDKLRENEVFRTKTFLSEIRAEEKRNMARRQLRSKKQRLLTLSNVRFTEQDIELKLSDEIKGSLRELKPESGLLTDRYKSFQKRGIVEPRCKRNKPKRKYKIKYKEKREWRAIEA